MILLLLALLVAVPFSASAEEADRDSLFLAGNGAFLDGRYSEAISHYEAIRASGIGSGPLYYNLGTAYFKADDLGRSMANFQRALRLNPRDGDLRENIRILRGRTLDKEMRKGRFPLLRLAGEVAGRLTWREWLVWGEALYVLWMILVALRFARPSLRGRFRTGIQIVSVALLMVIGLLGRAYRDQEILRQAVVLPGETAIRSGPGERFTEEFLLHPGTVLVIEGQTEGWALVEVGPDLKGWLKADAIEEI